MNTKFEMQVVEKLMQATLYMIQTWAKRNNVTLPPAEEMASDPVGFQQRMSSIMIVHAETNALSPDGTRPEGIFFESWCCDRRNGQTSIEKTYPRVHMKTLPGNQGIQVEVEDDQN